MVFFSSACLSVQNWPFLLVKCYKTMSSFWHLKIFNHSSKNSLHLSMIQIPHYNQNSKNSELSNLPPQPLCMVNFTFFLLSTLFHWYSHENMLHMLEWWEKILYCHPRAQEYPLFNNRMPAGQMVLLLNP